jgi:hypothetical protein
MKNFNLKITLPSGRDARIKEISNRVYFNILKFCENQDLEGINEYLEDTIFTDYRDIDIIDRLYIMLYYRMLFVSENIVFSSDNLQGKFKEVKYNIRTILEKIEEQYEDHSSIIKEGDFTVTLGLPNTLFFKTVDDVYDTIIKNITYKNKTISLSEASAQEKDAILSHLPHSIFLRIREYVDSLSQSLSNFVLIEANTDFDIQQHEINIISNGLMAFICSLFSGGLSSFYMTMFNFISKLHLDSDLFFNITPIEMRILFNIHTEEIEEQNRKEQEKSKR